MNTKTNSHKLTDSIWKLRVYNGIKVSQYSLWHWCVDMKQKNGDDFNV